VDWDADSPRLRDNLDAVLRGIGDAARRREFPSVEEARGWQARTMDGLDVPDPKFVGSFRGEEGLEEIEVRIGRHWGVAAADVAAALAAFETRLQEAVELLDELLPPGAEPEADSVRAVIDLCAWAHAEWVRIHPFANGNGRTARLWANCLAMRYDLPPFIRLRPRPDRGYGAAGEQAMRGDWTPTAAVFRQMFREFLEQRRE
jgi:fido (protein-threonine AMPylation protein)